MSQNSHQEEVEPSLDSPLLTSLENGDFDELWEHLPTKDVPLRLGPDQLTPLHYATQHGRLDIITRLVNEYHYDTNSSCVVAPTPLQIAAACGHSDIVEYILSNNPELSLKPGVVGPLHLAADNGHLGTLKVLVNAKICRLPVSDHEGNTPLHHAAAHGHLKIVEYLCDDVKHPISVENKKGESPLHIAAKHSQFAIVKYLIDEKHCDPAAKDGKVGSTPLHLAAKSGCLKIVQYLANEKTCNIESKTYSKSRRRAASITSGKTPLHYACFGGHKAVVEYLVKEQICNPRTTDDEGLTPFHLACQEGHVEIVQFFLGLKMNEINEPTTESGRTPIHCAAFSGNINILKELVESTNCDLNAVDSEGRTAVHYAARNGCTDIVQTLVEEHKCNVNMADLAGNTPLHLAAKFGYLDTVKYLFSCPQCTPSPTEGNGYTPLHLAAYKGHIDVVTHILNEKLISVMCRDKTGRTPLHLAAQTGSLPMVKALASHPDCDPSCIDKGLKATPLHIASGCGHIDIVRYLVDEKGSNPASTDKFNSTPVHRAAASGHLDIVKYLVTDKQCGSISKNKFGNSPLHLACQKGQLKMVQLLLNFSKENITQRNQVGRMPLDLVNNSDILGEFLRLGVDPSKSSITTRYPYLKDWSLLPPAVKVFILGDSGVGKTTLVKALQGEGFVTEWLSGRFQRIGAANGETVGINVTTFESRHFDKVVLYDLSGHHDYFAGHSAVINLACQGSFPIFVTMVDLRKTPQEIEKSVAYWSKLVELSLPKEGSNCTAILLGNHENELSKDGYRHKPALLEKAIQSQGELLKYRGWLTIDCRRVASNNMHRLRQLLSQSCDEARGSLKPSYECSLLRAFIQHKFNSPIVMEYRDLQEYISHSDIPCFNQDDTLFQTCQLLHSRGYILFLPDQHSNENSWIVLNQQAVLSMIHGFQKHVDFTNSVGMLPVSQLEKSLGIMGFNLTLVIQYFLRMEFCLRVVDRRLLYSIVGFDPPSPIEDHLFFPHLITASIPAGIWSHDPMWGCGFGWIMSCSENSDFFTPRFAQLLLLKIAWLFPFNTNPNSPFITRRQLTHLWADGITWTDTRGIQALIALEDNSTTIVVLLRKRVDSNCSMDLCQLRSLLLKEIRLMKENVCPKVAVSESLLQSSTIYPLESTRKMYSMESVCKALLQSVGARLVAAEPDQPTSLGDVIQFEIYNFFSLEILEKVFSDVDLQESDLTTIGEQLSSSRLTLKDMARVLNLSMPSHTEGDGLECVLVLLRRWYFKADKRTFSDFRMTMDKYSILAGYPIENALRGAAGRHLEQDEGSSTNI